MIRRPGLEAGASFEGLVVDEVARLVGERQVHFWATQGGAELDLLVFAGGKRWGVEVKYADAPAATKSMHVALADLREALMKAVRGRRLS